MAWLNKYEALGTTPGEFQVFTIDYMLIALVIIITTDLYHYSYRYCFVHHACFQV